MGMYTELVLKCCIKDDIPDVVENVLQKLFNGNGEVLQLPEHKFFTLPRWRQIGSSSSYYHIPWSNSRYADGYIFSRSDLKNYDGEIGAFIDWLQPYISEPTGVCIGWFWYEEEDAPTLLYSGIGY